MTSEYTRAGSEAALEQLGFNTKEANLLFSGAKAALLGLKNRGAALATNAAETASRAGQAASSGIKAMGEAGAKFNTGFSGAARRGAEGVATRLGKDPAQVARWGDRANYYTQDVGTNILADQALTGTLYGGMNAAMAEDGNRLEAFGKGFGQGALAGTATGLAGGVFRNVRRQNLTNKANQMGLANAGDVAQQQVNQRLDHTVRGLWDPKFQGQLGRAGNVSDLKGVAGQFIADQADMVLPIGAIGGVAAATPSQPQQAAPNPQQPQPMQARPLQAAPLQVRQASYGEDRPVDFPPEYVGSALGSAGGFQLGAIPLGLMKEKGMLKGPKGVFVGSLLPTATGLLGGLTGYQIAKQQGSKPELPENLEQVDFDHMLKHYNTTEQSPGY